MKSRTPLVLALLASLLFLGVCASAQITPVTQSFTEFVSPAPPAMLNSQTFSNSTNTGLSVSSTGGSIAAGTYRVCVTFFTATNTETPCSTDTATTSTVTTTGSTSTLTVQPPVAVGVGANVVGWRIYVGASGGAAAAETLQTLTSSICTLSTSSTASCTLTSPAVFTASTNFTGGSGGPATPGTAIYPPVTNGAATALYENSAYQYHAVYWTVTGTAPSACTFNIQQGTTVAGLTNAGQTITCTAAGRYALPLTTANTYSAVNLATFTPGDTTTVVTFYETVSQFNPAGLNYFGNATPTSACTALTSLFVVSGATSAVYTCAAGTWTAITLP